MDAQNSTSYLSGNNTSRYSKMPGLPTTHLIITGTIVVLIGLIYAALAALYLLMIYDPSYEALPSTSGLAQSVVQVASINSPELKKPASIKSISDKDDPHGTAHIDSLDKKMANFYRKNKHVGDILIITGIARNNYKEPRSHIKIRGRLLGVDEKDLAASLVYAGNILSEAELVDLSIIEIQARLNVKNGLNSKNKNIPPGEEIPFMLVFDSVPEGADQYRIDPVNSEPANLY